LWLFKRPPFFFALHLLFSALPAKTNFSQREFDGLLWVKSRHVQRKKACPLYEPPETQTSLSIERRAIWIRATFSASVCYLTTTTRKPLVYRLQCVGEEQVVL
jgi:hypothetical protein